MLDAETSINQFGAWLRAARQARGWTMEELADAGETSQPVVSTIERGVRNASRKMVMKLAQALIREDDDPSTAQNLINAALTSAGFQSVGKVDDPLRTIVRKAGYDDQIFGDEDYQQLEANVETIIAGIVAQRRKAQGRDE